MHEPIDERNQRGADVAIRGEDRVALADERREEAVTRGEALADQCLGDGFGLVDVMDVADDAAQVANIDNRR